MVWWSIQTNNVLQINQHKWRTQTISYPQATYCLIWTLLKNLKVASMRLPLTTKMISLPPPPIDPSCPSRAYARIYSLKTFIKTSRPSEVLSFTKYQRAKISNINASHEQIKIIMFWKRMASILKIRPPTTQISSVHSAPGLSLKRRAWAATYQKLTPVRAWHTKIS